MSCESFTQGIWPRQAGTSQGTCGVINTYVGYQAIARDMAKSLAQVEKQPTVERESEYYLKNITKVKSIEEFMDDARLFRFAMKAHGLEDMAYAKAFMVKVLEGGIDEDDSFANKLTDTRYREFAETFNFARYGETATVFTRAQQGTVDKYVRQTLEADAGETNEGVRLALYFQRKAAKIENAFQILADPALTKVAFTALGLPSTFSSANIDKQAKLLEEKIDFADFKDASGTGEFLKRFTSLWEVENGSSSTPNVSLLFSQPTEMGISMDVMMTLQRMKF